MKLIKLLPSDNIGFIPEEETALRYSNKIQELIYYVKQQGFSFNQIRVYDYSDTEGFDPKRDKRYILFMKNKMFLFPISKMKGGLNNKK